MRLTPAVLAEDRLGEVIDLVATLRESELPAPQSLVRSDCFVFNDYNVGRVHRFDYSRAAADFSLTKQLPAIVEFQPEALFFTAYSSVPTADIFRGIYDELGVEIPVMGLSPNSIDVFTHGIARDRTVSAMREVLDGRTRVAIVDQYVCTGKTLDIGRDHLEEAGAKEVLPVLGDWYEQAYRDLIGTDTEQFTSIFALELHAAGVQVVANQN